MSSSRFRQLTARLWREHAAPTRLGLGVGLGVLIGCSPLFGLHSLIAIGLAIVLRLNKIAVLLGTQVSIPPLAPLLALVSINLGGLLLGGKIISPWSSQWTWRDLPGLLGTHALYWIVGSLLLGAALGLIAFGVTALVARREPSP